MFEWITELIDRGGYLGIALLMFLESIFPPIPSWLVMPLAGFQASVGRLSPIGVMLAGTAGSAVGAMWWYFIGRVVGVERLKSFAARHGHWLTMTPDQVERSDRWFDRHGGLAVMIARVVPIVRTLISVPAGVFAMDVKRFILFTLAGDLAWNGLLVGAGYSLGVRYAHVANYLDPIAAVVLTIVAGIYLVRLIGWTRR